MYHLYPILYTLFIITAVSFYWLLLYTIIFITNNDSVFWVFNRKLYLQFKFLNFSLISIIKAQGSSTCPTLCSIRLISIESQPKKVVVVVVVKVVFGYCCFCCSWSCCHCSATSNKIGPRKMKMAQITCILRAGFF